MFTKVFAIFLLNWGLGLAAVAASSRITDLQPLSLPRPGDYQLRIIAPAILELTLISTKEPDPARVLQWNFVNDDQSPRLPGPESFVVSVGSQKIPVQSVGFKRRVLYAPLKARDLRIGNHLYLQLARPIADHQQVEVQNPDGKLWPSNVQYVATSDPLRWSPAIHVNQVGYVPRLPKQAMIGFYLGSLGELDLDPATGMERNGRDPASAPTASPPRGFKLVEASTGREVHQGRLTPRPDQGFPDPAYQKVLEADFSAFQKPGEYRLLVSGLGASFPFFIENGVAATLARTYALGLYHQRCGTANELPFTRHVHGPCHTNLVAVPTATTNFANAQFLLAQSTVDCKSDPRHTAPQVKEVSASLYPFVSRGMLDASGGHHDAGDYSKYTINSAGLIHDLVFAADNFPGVGELDNLGLPESGDGRSDILQEAKWEADFLAKMQDADGGFYYLVYPRNRRYENNVPPDQGDPQIVWPKNTAATAAAVAALAQCASSPQFKKQFPEAAALYLEKARQGWAFLIKAIEHHGRAGAYQKLIHYGHEFTHDDELAWAAAEMFLATGDRSCHEKLTRGFDPNDRNTRRWSWLRMCEGYGRAIRSYAFAARSGRVKPATLDETFLAKCESEVEVFGQEQLRRARDSAYGTSFPAETKQVRSAGWYFSSDAAFDLAVAYQLDYPELNDPRPKLLEAMLSNLNYEAGGNPVNVTYVTGVGWRRQREIVHQNAQNDRRVLPPSGVPIGNIQGSFMWIDHYKQELGALSFPPDGGTGSPYPFYDRWGDSFNLNTEFVILNQGRALATTAFLLARTPLKTQRWKSAPAQITGVPSELAIGQPVTARVAVPGLDLSRARIVWEARDREPAFGSMLTFRPEKAGPHWVEAEAILPDGRMVFAITNVTARPVQAEAGPAPFRRKP